MLAHPLILETITELSSMTIYRRIWEKYHNQKIPKGFHIHHLDGNNKNNSIENLICVSAHVHWCIHLLQGDPVALSGKFIQNCSLAGKKGGRKNKGKRRTKEQKDEISKRTRGKNNGFYGKTHSEELKKRLSEERLGKSWGKHKEETKNKISAALTGRNFSEEHKANISKSHNKIYICPHCNKSGGRMMLRWHFDKCKHK